MKNELSVVFDAISENESLARIIVSGFLLTANPTVDELADIKTAISEAVTNAIIHGYESVEGKVKMNFQLEDRILTVHVRDEGCGIADIKQAMEPMYTSKPELERSGMGFTFMEAFMDEVEVESTLGKGTEVFMSKKLSKQFGEKDHGSDRD